MLYSPLPPLRLHGLAQGVGGGELLLLNLLPGVELLVRSQQDVLVPELIHTDPSLGPDDCVDPPDLVGHLPGALKTPDIVLAEVVSKVPISRM